MSNSEFRVSSFRSRPQKDRGFHEGHIEHTFLRKDQITKADIQEYIDTVLDVSEITSKSDSEVREYFILDVLNFDTIFSWLKQDKFYKDKIDEETEEIIRNQIVRLRQGIFEELKRTNLISPRNVLLLEGYYNDQTSEESESPVVAHGVDGNKKEVVFRDWKTADYTDDSVLNRNLEKERDAYILAMRVFLSAVEDNPNDSRLVHFPKVKGFDSTGNGTLIEHTRIVSLDDIIFDIYGEKHQRPTKLEHIVPELELLQEAMIGATFLEDHGLVLRDICPQNISLDIDSEHAVLHDIGSLLVNGETKTKVIAHTEYFPPEVKNNIYLPATSQEMVYQFGRVLETLAGASNIKNDGVLYDIGAKMTNVDPKKRISLKDAIEEIGKVLDLCNE